jgi:hypothetical protein
MWQRTCVSLALLDCHSSLRSQNNARFFYRLLQGIANAKLLLHSRNFINARRESHIEMQQSIVSAQLHALLRLDPDIEVQNDKVASFEVDLQPSE